MSSYIRNLRRSPRRHSPVTDISGCNPEVRPMADKHYTQLVHKTAELSKSLNPSNELLDELVRRRVFSGSERRRVLKMKKETSHLKSREIIEMLKRKPDSAFDGFIKALAAVGRQKDAAKILGVRSTTRAVPMTREHRIRLIRELKELRQHIGKHDALAYLEKIGAFGKLDIKCATRKGKFDWEEFAKILLRKSDSSYYRTKKSIKLAEQHMVEPKKYEKKERHDSGNFTADEDLAKAAQDKQKMKQLQDEKCDFIEIDIKSPTLRSTSRQSRSKSADIQSETKLPDTTTLRQTCTLAVHLMSFTTAGHTASDPLTGYVISSSSLAVSSKTPNARKKRSARAKEIKTIESFSRPEDETLFFEHFTKFQQVVYCSFKSHFVKVYLKHDAKSDVRTLEAMKQHVKCIFSKSSAITVDIWKMNGPHNFKLSVGQPSAGGFMTDTSIPYTIGTIGCFADVDSSVYLLTVGHIQPVEGEIIYAVMQNRDLTEVFRYGIVEKKWNTNTIDASLIKIDAKHNGNKHENVVDYANFKRIKLDPKPKKPDEVKVNEDVELFCDQFKVNRKYGGTVLDVRCFVPLQNNSGFFRNCIVLVSQHSNDFTFGGESGMLVTTVPKRDGDSVEGIGMIFANSALPNDPTKHTSVAQPLFDALETIRNDPAYSSLKLM